MAFSDIEYQAVTREVERFVESIRPPENIRNMLDIVYNLNDQIIVLSEQRPVCQGAPGETTEITFARIKYVRSVNRWKTYWLRKDRNWHLYSVELSLAEALEGVKFNPNAIFFG